MKKIVIPFALMLVTTISQIATASDFAVPMNTERKITFYSSVNEDCTSLGDSVVRLITEPQHGTISTKKSKDHPNFPTTNPRNACNSRNVPSLQVLYRPQKNYVGQDTVVIQVIFPDGHTRNDTISINVQ